MFITVSCNKIKDDFRNHHFFAFFQVSFSNNDKKMSFAFSFKIISISFSVIVSMSILIPAFTTLQETVSKYFNKRESKGRRLMSEFVRRRRGLAAKL